MTTPIARAPLTPEDCERVLGLLARVWVLAYPDTSSPDRFCIPGELYDEIAVIAARLVTLPPPSPSP